MDETLDRVRAGEEDPPCEVCGGILKSDTISFGQSLVPEVIDKAMRVSEECDLLLAVGSTLSVYPAANCVPRAKASGARIVIVNGGPTDMDRIADAVLNGPIGDLLPALTDGLTDVLAVSVPLFRNGGCAPNPIAVRLAGASARALRTCGREERQNPSGDTRPGR